MEQLEIENNQPLELADNNQNKFLNSSLGNIINFSLDTGIRALLPDIVEDEVIDIKDTMLNEGFGAGIKQAVDDAINLGKSALGIITGNFENIGQVKKAIEKGGIIEGISNVIDYTLNKIKDANLLKKSTVKSIKKGKDVILDNISSNIEKEFTSQEKNIQKLEKEIGNWKEKYNNKDVDNLEKISKTINDLLEKTLPLENIIKEARKIQNIQEILKNNGNNFDLSEEQLKLTEVLQ